MKFSICIPVHDMANKEFFLRRSLDALWNQTEQDFEVIVSDNSEDDVLKNVCDYYKTGVVYFKNPRKGMAQNTNAAIRAANGKLIKILYLDDYLAHTEALEDIWNGFTKNWLVTGCLHQGEGGERTNPHAATFDVAALASGINTVGSPSVITIANKDPLFFDENMTWLLDCDYYNRMYERLGEPAILKSEDVIIGLGPHQATNTLSNELKLAEQHYLLNKNNG